MPSEHKVTVEEFDVNPTPPGQSSPISASMTTQENNSNTSNNTSTSDFDASTNSDFLLAKMLQDQYDKEHDELLDREERKFNGTSKGKNLKNIEMHAISIE